MLMLKWADLSDMTQNQKAIAYTGQTSALSVEHNITFNESDILMLDSTTTIPGDALAEGEKEKVIQSTPSPSNSETAESSDNHSPDNAENDKPSNEDDKPVEAPPDPNESTGRPQRPRKEKGAYRLMHEGLAATVTQLNSEEEPPLDYALFSAEPREAFQGPNAKQW